jgi:hypothetical protein
LTDLQAYVKQTLATLENVPLDEQVDYLQSEAYRLVGDVETVRTLPLCRVGEAVA